MSEMVSAAFRPGEVWYDTAHSPIQAHGGGVLLHNGVYYWYGENKDGPTYRAPGAELVRVDMCGIACYSSTDLLNWRNEGIVLPAVTQDVRHDLHPSCVAERPKVIYHAGRRQFVLWLHIDDAMYSLARVGVAVSDTPTGPFNYLGSVNPQGMDSRDMTLFQDDDGAAYLICSTEMNRTLRVMRLRDDYLAVLPAATETTARILIERSREAPAVCKHAGRYYLLTSGCTGWEPNATTYATAPHLLGPWTEHGNPCRGLAAATSFGCQGTFILPLAGASISYIWLADRWNPANLRDSRYVWLPIDFTNAELSIAWHDAWELSHAGFKG